MESPHRQMATRIYEAWNREGPDGAAKVYDPDVEWHDPPHLPDARIHRGLEAVRAQAQAYLAAVGPFQVDVLEFAEAPGCVVAQLRMHGPGIADVPFEEVVFEVFEAGQDGCRRARHFLDRDAAFAAAGVGLPGGAA